MNKRLGLLFGFCLLVTGMFGQSLKRYEFTEPHMGTSFRIILYAEDSTKASTAVRAAFLRIEELNQCMSDYLPDSELNLLSKKSGSKERIKVSDDLWRVLRKARFFSKKSRGAFDITIGPLSKLWRRAMRKVSFPEQDKLDKANALVGYKHIRLHKRTQSVRLLKTGIKLDLGGIAKGFAVEQALEVLQEAGFNRSLVDGGGDISLGDPPPQVEGWKIEIPAYSFPKDQMKEYLQLENCSIATSGDTYKYIELDGIRYSHIIDPRTGLGISKRRMLTVIAQAGMTADALASTLSIQGNIDQNKLRKRYKDPSIHVRFIEWENN